MMDETPGRRATPRLSPNIVVLGIVSLLMGMSSAMVHSLLPVFLVTIVGASAASVGLIEGIAEATTSFIKVLSGAVSDWTGRRKPLVVLGYALSAVSKILFPLAHEASIVMLARVADRIGKGVRDSPRDALMADMTPSEMRGRGFGLRLALYTIGAVLGPLAAMLLMTLSDDDFRLVFWCALVPAIASVVVLQFGVQERADARSDDMCRTRMRATDARKFGLSFWWVVTVAALLSLARFSSAFIVLKTHHVGIDAAYVPLMLALMNVVYSLAAYPFGILADQIDRRVQLIAGATVLLAADVILLGAGTVWMTALGAALWGLQMGMTQGLLGAAVADAAPGHLRGTAFAFYDIAVGVATLLASTGAGLLWSVGGPSLSFGAGAIAASAAVALLLVRRMPPRQKHGIRR
jgi:MFS family permease